ncbi:OmpA family protein [Hyphomicrobium sp.]|uniref:OmpA family protein n=1 Tax=Hyphomicrobium sp. TaxID=82 RepID=UPI003F701BE9
MTLRAVPLLLALPLAFFNSGRAVSEVPGHDSAPGFSRADTIRSDKTPMDGRIELAQKQPWAEGNPPPGNNNGGNPADANAARQKAIKQKQIQAEQAKQKALQQQQNAIKARDEALKNRQNAVKQQQLQGEQAKQKALQQQQNAIKARDEALKNRQIQGEQAKQKALQQQQNAIKARDEAIKNRQNAIKDKQLQNEQARQNALKQKQLQGEQAKQKALQQQQDAIRARDEALKNRQKAIDDKVQARDKALQQRKDAVDNATRARQDALKARDDAVRKKQLDAEAARQNALKQTQGAGPKGNWSGAANGKAIFGTPPKAFDRGAADKEFQRARDQARDFNKGGGNKGGDKNLGGFREVENWRPDATKKFDDVRNGRKERTLFDGRRRDIIEPDNRVIIRQNDRSFIRHDESNRFKRTGREVRRERRKDGLTMIVTMGLAGALIYSLQDDDGQLYRRSRRDRDGRELVLIDNRHYYGRHRHSRFDEDRDYRDAYVELPPPRIRIPRDEYIVDYDRASSEEVYDTLMAPPVERLDRGYSLDEVRHSYSVLERMRRVDLDAVNFGFGSWEVGEDQYPKLESMAKAMLRILNRSPDEVFLIEGHTDAVGSDIDNLSLSDRRAETVAVILSDVFDVPPENLTTQGYGEQYLKVPTEEPSRINRRVSVRRITPLLSKEGWNDRD